VAVTAHHSRIPLARRRRPPPRQPPHDTRPTEPPSTSNSRRIKLSTRRTASRRPRPSWPRSRLLRRPPANATVVCRRRTERREPCLDLVAEGDVSVRSCEGERVLRHRDGLRRLVTASVRDRAIEPDPR